MKTRPNEVCRGGRERPTLNFQCSGPRTRTKDENENELSKEIMKRKTGILLLVALVCFFEDDRCTNTQAAAQVSKQPILESVRGGIAFPAEKRMWTRIVGKVKVLDAHTVVFEDGTEVNLHWNMNAPDLEQKGLIGGSFYAAGKEAAEFLRKLIGDQTVTFIGRLEDKQKMRGPCFLGETSIEIEMVRNGWAISDHEGMDPWEIMARDNKRGLWRGEFVVPNRWRKGERLPGE